MLTVGHGVLSIATLGSDGQAPRTRGLIAARWAAAPPLHPPPLSASPSASPPPPLPLSSSADACLCSGSPPYCRAADSYCYPSSADRDRSSTLCPGNCSLAPPPLPPPPPSPSPSPPLP